MLRTMIIGICLSVSTTLAADRVSGTGDLIRWSDSLFELEFAKVEALKPSNATQLVQNFVERELVLDAPILIEISERPHAFYDEDLRRVDLPIANLYRVYDDLKAKFPEQEQVRKDIYDATFQFYVLSEFLRAVSKDLELRISGWEAERIDALVSILLLESELVSQPYILDAAEEFLLIDRLVASIDSQRFKTEFEADEYRLSQILCLMKAYDASKLDVRWDEPNGCSNYYRLTMNFWSKVLHEHLRDKAQLKQWGQSSQQ